MLAEMPGSDPHDNLYKMPFNEKGQAFPVSACKITAKLVSAMQAILQTSSLMKQCLP